MAAPGHKQNRNFALDKNRNSPKTEICFSPGQDPSALWPFCGKARKALYALRHARAISIIPYDRPQQRVSACERIPHDRAKTRSLRADHVRAPAGDKPMDRCGSEQCWQNNFRRKKRIESMLGEPSRQPTAPAGISCPWCGRALAACSAESNHQPGAGAAAQQAPIATCP
jgi:hypothetical protein